MATVRLAPLVLLAACSDLQQFGGDVPPFTTLHVNVTGDFATVRESDEPASLRVAIVWGAQWLSEPLCTTPPDTTELAQLMAAGCRHPLYFTPKRAADSVAIDPNVPLDLPLFDLPGADVMVGGLTARVAYASLVVYDDRDGDGLLGLRRMQRPPYGDSHGPAEDETDPDPVIVDVIYGASFAAMTEPDTRLAFREGTFNPASAFYPRIGCGDPPEHFGVLSAGGFSLSEAYAAVQEGRLPSQDPATCVEATPATATIEIPLRKPSEVNEVACRQRNLTGTIRYRQPPVQAIDFTDRTYLCRLVPETQTTELIVTQQAKDPCRGLTHYVLRGCDDEKRIDCEAPSWDFTQAPPQWWPCAP